MSVSERVKCAHVVDLENIAGSVYFSLSFSLLPLGRASSLMPYQLMSAKFKGLARVRNKQHTDDNNGYTYKISYRFCLLLLPLVRYRGPKNPKNKPVLRLLQPNTHLKLFSFSYIIFYCVAIFHTQQQQSVGFYVSSRELLILK